MKLRAGTAIFVLFTMLSSAACSKKSSSTDGTATGGAGSTTIANPDVKASNIADLNLTGVLQLDLPESATGAGSTGLVGLLNGQKSVEACRMRQSMRQSIQMIDMIRMSLCHIEAEASSIAFNKPVLLSMGGSAGGEEPGEMPEGEIPEGEVPTGEIPAGETPPDGFDPNNPPEVPGLKLTQGAGELFGVYVDTTDAEAVNVYMCSGSTKEDMTLSQVFRITGSEDNRSKGEMILSQAMGDMNFGASVAFDAGHTTEGTFAMEMKMKFSDGGENSFASFLNMKLVDGGVSFIQTADSGDFGGQNMNNSAAARFGEDAGMVLFALDTSYQGQEFKSEAAACVDGAGYMIGCDDAQFQDGGDLYTATTDVPGTLPADFEATKPSGFDCATLAGSGNRPDRHHRCRKA